MNENPDICEPASRTSGLLAVSDCVTLWVGGSLGPVERACMRSVLRQGHSLALFCYREPAGVPAGVALRDASEVLPETNIFMHRSGSPALFADWFRLELQKQALGTWVDADMYLLAPIELAKPYLLAEEEPGLINNAVLRLPSDCPMLPRLIEPFERGTTPEWLPWHSYLPAKLRELVRGRADLARMPWGSTGPYALTKLARRFGLHSLAVPPDVFHPVNWRNAEWILDSRQRVEDVSTERTVGLHLWNHCIRNFKSLTPPRGSFLERLHAEGRA